MRRSSVGERIRRLRTRRGLTQKELATAAGVDVRTVRRAEDGSMSADTTALLAEALGVPLEELTAPIGVGDYPQITPVLYYSDAETLDWLVRVFGLTERVRHVTPDGRIQHAELALGEGLIMAATPSAADGLGSPSALDGATTQSLYVMVDDIDDHYGRARDEGAKILAEPQNAQGHRRYAAADPEGHVWQFWSGL